MGELEKPLERAVFCYIGDPWQAGEELQTGKYPGRNTENSGPELLQIVDNFNARYPETNVLYHYYSLAADYHREKYN